MRANGVTLKHIATILNLSVSTVSKALSNSPEISNTTTKRIVKTANILNYKPNVYAAALKSKRSYIIGIILPDLKDEFFLDVLNGIAYNKTSNTIFVTGKMWDKLFEIKIFPKK